MHILVIEDDPSLARLTEAVLAAEGHEVTLALRGEDGIAHATEQSYDVILLDLTLPDMGGIDVLRTLRRLKVTTPIMIVSGENEVEKKVSTFSAGADEFLAKPWHRDELLARICALARRAKGHAANVMRVGNLTINLDAGTVLAGGSEIHLTQMEYRLLECLALRKGAVVSKEGILSYLYNDQDVPGHKIVDVFACKLRKKLADANDGEHHIETSWGRGYSLQCPTAAQVA